MFFFIEIRDIIYFTLGSKVCYNTIVVKLIEFYRSWCVIIFKNTLLNRDVYVIYNRNRFGAQQN